MAHYTIQISNHPDAGSRIPTEEASQSWATVHDGSIATAIRARNMVDELAQKNKHVRAFRGMRVGKMWYAVLRRK